MQASEYYEIIANRIHDKAKDREVVCWGYNPEYIKCMKEQGLSIEKIFSANKTLIEKQGCISPELLKDASDKLFVIFPTAATPATIKKLRSFGYSDDDFLTMFPERKIVLTDGFGHFHDDYGNTVEGFAQNLKIEITGYNNEIRIGEGVSIPDKLVIRITSPNNRFFIGNKCVFKGDYLGDSGVLFTLPGKGGTVVDIGSACRFMKAHINTGNYTELYIGEKTTFEPGLFIQIDSCSKVDIGKDCMFSSDAMIQSTDGHSIFDVETKKNVNSLLKEGEKYIRTVKIGDHVWIGRRSMIIGDTSVGAGSVIGGQSLVKGTFPNNVVIAGTPARILAKNRAWARKQMAENIADCGIYTDFTNEDI